MSLEQVIILVLAVLIALGLFFYAVSYNIGAHKRAEDIARLKENEKEIARLKEQLKNAQKKDKVEVTYTVNDGRVPKFGKF